jgi:allantoinase
MTDRDFAGDRAGRHPLRWPGDKRLAVSFVLNIEEGAEYALSAGDERNEGTHEVTHEIVGARDFCMESHFEFGARVGYHRVAREFVRRSIPLTLNVCGRALEATPWVAEDAMAHGWELCCHGWRWESHAGMAEATERDWIQRCIATVERLTGRRPVGWHTKSSRSENTRRLLVENGFLYDSDAYNDERPYFVDVGGHRHLVLPYAFDTNDMRFFVGGAFVRGRDFADYVIDACQWQLREAEQAPGMLTIGLHSRIIGRPARMGGLVTLLDHLEQQPGIWLATRESIARHWMQCDAAERTP